MKSIQAAYGESEEKITVRDGAKTEDWGEVCRKFNDDVERVRDVRDVGTYTGLYVCRDDADTCFYYLVEEDRALYRLKRKHFLDNIGLK